jgi:hypothetical protein
MPSFQQRKPEKPDYDVLNGYRIYEEAVANRGGPCQYYDISNDCH